MADVKQRHRRLFGTGEGTERIEAFSDAVFAIALTLLVLDIRLPEGSEGDDLLPALLALWPQFFAYVLSFVIIALNWIIHHRKFRVIERFDTALLWINLVLLMFIALVPFPTSVLSDTGETPAVVLYALTVSMLSILQGLLWWYAKRRGFVSADVDEQLSRYVLLSILPAPLVFLASIPVAILVAPDWAMYSWFLIFPVSVLIDRIAISRSRDSASEAAR
jgi:uncharacterized membrane protein